MRQRSGIGKKSGDELPARSPERPAYPNGRCDSTSTGGDGSSTIGGGCGATCCVAGRDAGGRGRGNAAAPQVVDAQDAQRMPAAKPSRLPQLMTADDTPPPAPTIPRAAKPITSPEPNKTPRSGGSSASFSLGYRSLTIPSPPGTRADSRWH